MIYLATTKTHIKNDCGKSSRKQKTVRSAVSYSSCLNLFTQFFLQAFTTYYRTTCFYQKCCRFCGRQRYMRNYERVKMMYIIGIIIACILSAIIILPSILERHRAEKFYRDMFNNSDESDERYGIHTEITPEKE